MIFPFKWKGFTIIELMVVMAVIGLLMSVVAPRYLRNTDKAKESVLKQNLYVLRDALDKHFADRERYPETLEALVTMRYIRHIPEDPFTQKTDTWILIPPQNRSLGAIFDVKSGAAGNALDGTAYASW